MQNDQMMCRAGAHEWAEGLNAGLKMLRMAKRKNREGLTQRTVLVLEWGGERAEGPV